MLAIGADHAAQEMKRSILALLDEKGYEYIDLGSDEQDAVDYPVIAKEVAQAVAQGRCEYGILLCGTGIGMSMAAGKVRGIRAAVCGDSYSARLTRMHNDANVLCMGARVIGLGPALDIVEAFLTTAFEGGRHQRRVDLITQIEASEDEGR